MTTHAIPTVRPAVRGVRPVTRVWDADEALEQLYAGHWRRLVRLSVLLVGDVALAEDVVQDAFVAVHRRWHRLRDPDRALAYLRQSVVNGSRSVLRHRGVVDRYVAREAGGTADERSAHRAATRPGADEDAVTAERRATVLAALQQLPRRQREVLALRYYGDLTEAEIAATMGISTGAVKSHASRGAAALRARLDRDGEELS